MSTSNSDYDIVVAGGGIAGMLAATSAAKYSKQSLKILVVDRNDHSEAGKKTNSGWICGDAVSDNKISYVEKHLGIRYDSPEIEHSVKGVIAYSPDHSTPSVFEGDGYLLNRKLFPQRQLRDAKKMGVEFVGGVSVTGAISENNFITGIKGLKRSNGKSEPFQVNAKIVIDCAGIASPIRNDLPIDSFIQRKIDRDDLEATGRYIFEFEHGAEDKTFFDPDNCLIHLDQELAPGGYAWVFPKGDNKVNIGLGVQKKRHDWRNKRMGSTDTLQVLLEKYVAANPVIKNPKVVEDGNGYGFFQVSVRRQADCMVANGYMIAGDTAWGPRAIDAGGIGPALMMAVLAGKHASIALESNDVSEKSLWSYTKQFFDEYGYKMASYEVLRRVLQSLDNHQINFGVNHVLSNLDVEDIADGDPPEFGKAATFNAFSKALFSTKLTKNFRTIKDIMYYKKKNEFLTDLNKNYPDSPDKFTEWHKILLREMHEVFEKYP